MDDADLAMETRMNSLLPQTVKEYLELIKYRVQRKKWEEASEWTGLAVGFAEDPRIPITDTQTNKEDCKILSDQIQDLRNLVKDRQNLADRLYDLYKLVSMTPMEKYIKGIAYRLKLKEWTYASEWTNLAIGFVENAKNGITRTRTDIMYCQILSDQVQDLRNLGQDRKILADRLYYLQELVSLPVLAEHLKRIAFRVQHKQWKDALKLTDQALEYINKDAGNKTMRMEFRIPNRLVEFLKDFNHDKNLDQDQRNLVNKLYQLRLLVAPVVSI